MKKQKRVRMVIAILSLMLVLCNSAYAAEDVNFADVITKARIEGTIISSRNAVYDFRKTPLKTFVPAQIGNNKAKAASSTSPQPHWKANSTLSTFLSINAKTISDSYLLEDETTRLPIDLIIAKARLYQNEVLLKSKQDRETHTSHAGISITSSELNTYSTNNLELYGSHTFEQAGYVSWYPETYKAG